MSSKSNAICKRIALGGTAAALALSLTISPLSVPEALAAPASKQAEAQAALTTLNAMRAKLRESEISYEEAMAAQMEAQQKMEEAQQRIDEANERIGTLQDHLGTRARGMYKSGSTSFLDILLGASTFQAFTTNWDLLNTMNQSDADLVAETKDLRAEVKEKKDEYAEQEKVAAQKTDEMKALVDETDALVAQQQAIYDSLSAEAAAIVKREQEAADNQGGSNNGGGSNEVYDESNLPSAPPGASARVQRAYSALNKPYAKGGVGPNSYDCSGLVGYCMTGSHSRSVTSGSFASGPFTNNPVPGDICWESGHVGIYIGGGQMIHAPEPGKNVEVSTVHPGMKYVRK